MYARNNENNHIMHRVYHCGQTVVCTLALLIISSGSFAGDSDRTVFASRILESVNPGDYAGTGMVHPQAVLGYPDGYVEHFNGPDGQVSVGFADIGTNGPGDDIRIHIIDFCDVNENLRVLVSNDQVVWTEVASYTSPDCGLSEFNIDVGAAGVDTFRYVRLANFTNVAKNDDGADFDAIEILHPLAIEPEVDLQDPIDTQVKHLVYLVHGYAPPWVNPQDHLEPFYDLKEAYQRLIIQSDINGSIDDMNEWEIRVVNWFDAANSLLPTFAIMSGIQHATIMFNPTSLDLNGIESVHFVGHSAGAHLVEQATQMIKDRYPNGSDIRIHTTFLDPFSGIALLPGFGNNLFTLGRHGDWVENYYVGLQVGLAIDLTGNSTANPLPFAYNILLDYSLGDWADCIEPPGDSLFYSHSYPVEFYRAVIDPAFCVDIPMDWPLLGAETTELLANEWPVPSIFSGDVIPRVPFIRGDPSWFRAGYASEIISTVDPSTSVAQSSDEISITPNSVDLSSTSAQSRSWARLDLNIEFPSSMIIGEIEWLGEIGSRGILSAYINGVEVGVYDQIVESDGASSLAFQVLNIEDPLSSVSPPGVYTLELVLDSFIPDAHANVVLSNIKIIRNYEFDANVNRDDVVDFEDAYEVLSRNKDFNDDGVSDQNDVDLLLQFLRRDEFLKMKGLRRQIDSVNQP